MKVTYDSRHNVAYIRFREQVSGVETITISDELNIDLGPDGSLYGIELLNANEQISTLGGRVLALEDTETGSHVEVPFPGDAA
ncbi:MAG: DUF2283 domain-containing protein [Chloroflexi bacterium]|nr:DUF2283 domain-containing protein [Chloroflexota bacterium]MDA1002973.1 DUF2283 domain-containing protein [Chloroflexota bacterium]